MSYLHFKFLSRFQSVLRLRSWEHHSISFLHFLQLKSAVLGKIAVINEALKFYFVKFVFYTAKPCISLKLDT